MESLLDLICYNVFHLSCSEFYSKVSVDDKSLSLRKVSESRRSESSNSNLTTELPDG